MSEPHSEVFFYDVIGSWKYMIVKAEETVECPQTLSSQVESTVRNEVGACHLTNSFHGNHPHCVRLVCDWFMIL